MIEPFDGKRQDIRRGMFEADPYQQTNLAVGLRLHGIVLQKCGWPAEAVSAFREAIAVLKGLADPTPGNVYDMACCRSLIAGAAREAGSGLTAAEGRAEAEQAVEGVRRALDAGFTELSWIRTGDPDLKPIRSRPDFQLLMMDLAFPTEPFENDDSPVQALPIRSPAP